MAAPWFNIPRDSADSAGMLAHLHGHFVGFDLLYDDEYRALGMSPLFAFVTEEGLVSNHWPTGATWLQSPGYILGLLSARVLSGLGIGKGDALGVVPLLAVRAWAVVLLGFAAWGITRLTRSRIAAVAVVVGTPAAYYASEAPLRPHIWGFVVVLALVALWYARDYGSPRARALALAGLAGLATAIRPQLLPLVLLAVHDAWRDPPGRWRRIALCGVGFLPWPLLALRVHAWMYGVQMGDYLRPVTHHVWWFLTSSHHGALIWCPVLLVGFFALGRSAFTRERGAWLIGLLVLHQLWVDGGQREIESFQVLGTRTWSGGVSFGPRKLLDALPLLLPAVVSLIEAARRRGLARPLAAATLVLCVPTALLHLAAFVDPAGTTGAIHTYGSLGEQMLVALDPQRWMTGVPLRAMPLLVPLIVGLVVALPLLVAVGRSRLAALRMAPRSQLHVLGATVLALALVVHAWTTALQVRTDVAVAEDPDRIERARLSLHPAHHRTVESIKAYGTMRAHKLGHGR